MKSIYKLFYGIVLLIALIISGCYKDKGNYELHEINKVSFIKNGSDTIKVNQFDTLKVQTQLLQSEHDDAANLSYKWSVYLYTPPLTGIIDEVISTEKNLNVQFGLRPDKYTLLYTVTDKNTGVSYFKKYYLEVSTKLSEGWLLISEDLDGKRDVDLLHPDGYAIKNILSTANPGMKIPDGLHTARVLTTFFGGSQNIYVLGKDDALRIKYTDFTKVNSAKDWFVEKYSSFKPQDFLYDMMGSNMFYIDNGKIFSNQVDFRFGAEIAGDYYLSKYFFPAQSSDGGVVYDTKNKKFYNYARKIFSSFSTSSDAPFDMNNVGMDVVFGGRAPSNQYSYLMKDAQNNLYVYRIHLGGPIGKYLVNNATKLSGAKNAVFSSLYFHMYYTVDNEVYLLDIANNTSKLVYSFPAGENITALQIKQTISSFVSYGDNNRTLAVGTFDGKEGKVYSFSIDNVGEFVGNTYTKLYDHLDKPVSLEYKNRK